MTLRLQVWGVTGIGEVLAGDDLAQLVATAEPDLRDGDVVVVTSKVVSKAEGRLVSMDRLDAVAAETVRVVAQRGDTWIVETRHGFVLAAAGVDASNVPPGQVALLPEDPDASAARIRTGLRGHLGVDVGVVVTDTFGRPWRNGLVDVAVGSSGVTVLDDHRGRADGHGHTLEMTVTAVADEIAAAAELVKGKLDGVPVAVVRGLDPPQPGNDTGARTLVRRADEDMFRLGTQEAMRAALLALSPAPSPASAPASASATQRAVEAAMAAATPLADRTWRIAVTERHLVACVVGDRADEQTLLGVGAALGNAVLALHLDGIAASWVAPDRLDEPVPEGCRAVAALRLG